MGIGDLPKKIAKNFPQHLENLEKVPQFLLPLPNPQLLIRQDVCPREYISLAKDLKESRLKSLGE